jgi:hypothetical protein
MVFGKKKPMGPVFGTGLVFETLVLISQLKQKMRNRAY